VDQGRLVGASWKVAVHRVVAEVRLTTDEPPGKRRVRIVEHPLERPAPVDQGRLLRPERLALFDRTAMKSLIFGTHSLSILLRTACPGVPISLGMRVAAA